MIRPEDNVPRKLDGYLFAQAVFYKQFNDASFYVEDAEQENLYVTIVRKVFPHLRIVRVFPLGGKDAVIKHAMLHRRDRSNVYLLDKDFDDLLRLKKATNNLFYLDRYSIENYLAEDDAIVSFVIAQDPSLKRD